MTEFETWFLIIIGAAMACLCGTYALEAWVHRQDRCDRDHVPDGMTITLTDDPVLGGHFYAVRPK